MNGTAQSGSSANGSNKTSPHKPLLAEWTTETSLSSFVLPAGM